MKPTITDITGIGPSTAQDLAEGGIRTVEDLANATSTAICAVPGFGAIRAARIKAAAAELLRRSASAAAQVESTEPTLEAEADSESEMTAEDLESTDTAEVSENSKEDKPKKTASKKDKKDKKGKKDKKSKKGKKDKGKPKKDKADKKGKSRGKKDKKSSGE